MATQLLIYGQVEAVNKKRHQNWSIKAENNYDFAKKVNSVPLMAAEFPHAAQDYSIVFAGEGKQLLPVVVMGIKQDENLYVNDQGQWVAKYIPAFVRRYPFVFASTDEDKTLTLCIDESYSGCNQDDKGERLFDSEGAQTQYLEKVLSFLQDYQNHYQRTQAFCEKLVELDLFEDMGAKFTLPTGEERTLTGFKVINKEKLKALKQEDLSALFASDGLELVYLHLHSLRNLNKMLQNTQPAQSRSDEHGSVH
ncbi:multidrug transporter [Vibrio sp. UCD-FRSSP16_10]|uniref:SapC family protein n=1 Tax=unclassified Vibrio TaxID=2614977 RepID=UPI0007FB904E|nr:MULTISPECIES: SapC family protein [unclassified Vibrio]OBT08540.1 multidrug transporter [Vibrio sp. UCD-FRSSP16_30]OBT18070.1 multidrug transporter [Vibrio sp. UCD-FRSSP16_10]